MSNFTKYNKFSFNLLKYFLIFLALNKFIYVWPAKNVTFDRIILNTSDKYNGFAQINIPSIHFQHNIILLNTNGHIFVFDGLKWTDIPLKEKSLITCDDQNNILIVNEIFIGKCTLSLKEKPTIDTLILNWQRQANEMPENFFSFENQIYLSTRQFFYKLDKQKLIVLDSASGGLTVFKGKNKVYVIKQDGITRFGQKVRDTISNNSLIIEDNNIYDLVEVDREIHKGPFYFRWWAWTLYGIIILFLVIVYWRKRKHDFETEKANLEFIINERTAELTREKQKTDDLLANLLPKDTVDELKNTGKATSQKFNIVTVLFSDIQGFTKIAEQMNPEKLIDELDNFFFHFDSVVEKYNIEKIKTIGDAYMCAGGIPYKNRTNPVEVVLAGLEMQEYMRLLRQKDVNIWDLRIGIHTGAVIAGVVGHKRMSYDIWGDTVNTASRMESSGEAGKVNISGHTYELVKDFFICEYRGKMPVKYKGDIDMYFVKGIRPELSVDLKMIPDKKFFIQLQILRLLDIEEHAINMLNNELPAKMYFHNSRYTIDIYILVELLGRAEGLSQEEMLLVRTTALLINTGFINSYDNYESESVKFARDILPKFRYSSDQIEAVCSLILSIRFTDITKTKTEAILIDACLNYLGRVDYLQYSLNHYKEVKERVPSLTEKEWFYHELRSVEQHQFYTNAAKMLREVSIEAQIQKIKEFAKFNESSIKP
jgi:adenylate cyclase